MNAALQSVLRRSSGSSGACLNCGPVFSQNRRHAYLLNEADLAPDGRDSASLCPLVSAGTEKHCSCLKSGGRLCRVPLGLPILPSEPSCQTLDPSFVKLAQGLAWFVSTQTPAARRNGAV